MRTSQIRKLFVAVLLCHVFVLAADGVSDWELSLPHLREHWVEQLSAIGAELNINFKETVGDPAYYRVNNEAERWFADENAPAPPKLTIGVTDRLALIGRHARLYYSALPDQVSPYGFTMREEVDGRNITVTNHAFMVLVGTNGIARGIGENGVVIVPPKVEAVQKVLAEAGLIAAPESSSSQKAVKRPKPAPRSTSTRPQPAKTKQGKLPEAVSDPSPQQEARPANLSQYLGIAALFLILLGALIWFWRRK